MNSDHNSNCNCTICESSRYKTIAFKAGFVCENCLQYVKSQPAVNEKASDKSPTNKL